MNRQADVDTLVTVFGASGFLGRHVVRLLAARGYRVRAAVRRPDLAGHLQPLGRTGQIHAVQANLRYPESVEAAVRDADAVVNLVGILAERGRQRFAAVHTEGAQAVARSARAIGARLVHVSAIGADPNSSSFYARSKAAGEQAVMAAVPAATVIRPSILFGPEDTFFNRFAEMARFSPVLPLIGGGETRFQPIFVGDAAEAVARSIDGFVQPGAVYELGGPEIRSFRELMAYMLQVIERRRMLVPVPFRLARMQGAVLQLLPGPLLTVDQVRSLETDNVVSADAVNEGRSLAGLGITGTAMEAVVPSYLWRFRRSGQFARGSA